MKKKIPRPAACREPPPAQARHGLPRPPACLHRREPPRPGRASAAGAEPHLPARLCRGHAAAGRPGGAMRRSAPPLAPGRTRPRASAGAMPRLAGRGGGAMRRSEERRDEGRAASVGAAPPPAPGRTRTRAPPPAPCRGRLPVRSLLRERRDGMRTRKD